MPKLVRVAIQADEFAVTIDLLLSNQPATGSGFDLRTEQISVQIVDPDPSVYYYPRMLQCFIKK